MPASPAKRNERTNESQDNRRQLILRHQSTRRSFRAPYVPNTTAVSHQSNDCTTQTASYRPSEVRGGFCSFHHAAGPCHSQATLEDRPAVGTRPHNYNTNGTQTKASRSPAHDTATKLPDNTQPTNEARDWTDDGDLPCRPGWTSTTADF